MLSPVPSNFASAGRPIADGRAVDAGLLLAAAKADQARIVGEVVEASIDRMAENRERREAERLEDDRETDRLRASERLERADAARTARNAERRAAEFRADARRGDVDAELLADREQGRSADAERRARNARVDITA